MELTRWELDTLFPARPAQSGGWEESLRSACKALAGAPPDLLKSISVTRKLPETERESLSLLRLSRRLAAEYRLLAVVQAEGLNATVLFHRPEVATTGDRR